MSFCTQSVLPNYHHDDDVGAPYKGVLVEYITYLYNIPVCRPHSNSSWIKRLILAHGQEPEQEHLVAQIESVPPRCHPEVIYLIWRRVPPAQGD